MAATDRPLALRKLQQRACDAMNPAPVDLETFVTTVGRRVACIGESEAVCKEPS